jgi:hypothetical protein
MVDPMKYGDERRCDIFGTTGKSPIPVFVRRVKPRNKKYSAFQNTQINGICFPVPVRQKGTYRAIATYVGPECDGRSNAALSSGATTAKLRTAKSCGPGAATVASIRPAS